MTHQMPDVVHCALVMRHGQEHGPPALPWDATPGDRERCRAFACIGHRKNDVIDDVTTTDIHGAIDAVWKIESAKLIAGLTRIVRDVGLAEDLAQEALLTALEQWAPSGVPDNPGAWLMATAKHRAIDQLRRRTLLDRKHEELGRQVAVREMEGPDLAPAVDATLDAGSGVRVV